MITMIPVMMIDAMESKSDDWRQIFIFSSSLSICNIINTDLGCNIAQAAYNVTAADMLMIATFQVNSRHVYMTSVG
jgi:hypothetical protein